MVGPGKGNDCVTMMYASTNYGKITKENDYCFSTLFARGNIISYIIYCNFTLTNGLISRYRTCQSSWKDGDWFIYMPVCFGFVILCVAVRSFCIEIQYIH